MRLIFDAVGFVDAGNVYRTLSEFRPWDLRTVAGAGLRVRTPYFLLRFDYGFKLKRRPDESRRCVLSASARRSRVAACRLFMAGLRESGEYKE